MVEMNRNQFFLAGMVVLLIGVQLRLVDTIVLNERATQFLAQRLQKQPGQIASTSDAATFFAAQGGGARKRIEPPKWLGWALVSVGAVLVLHSLALKKPG